MVGEHEAQKEVARERLEEFLQVRGEGDPWDFKQTIDVSNRQGRAELARDVMAFANTTGGHLIIGVVDKNFELVGVPEDLDLDTTKIHDAIDRYIDATVQTVGAAYWFEQLGWGASRRFGIIYIRQSASVPVRAARDSSVFEKGDIFVRRGARTCKANSSDLERLVRSSVFQTDIAEARRRDRELSEQPFLTFARISDTVLQVVKPYELSITNIGKGAAVSCHYWGGDYMGGLVSTHIQHFEAPVMSLPPDAQERRCTAQPTWPWAAVPALAGLLGGDLPKSVDVVLCLDILGNRYRFVRGVPLPEISVVGNPDPPPWAAGLPGP